MDSSLIPEMPSPTATASQSPYSDEVRKPFVSPVPSALQLPRSRPIALNHASMQTEASMRIPANRMPSVLSSGWINSLVPKCPSVSEGETKIQVLPKAPVQPSAHIQDARCELRRPA